MRPSLSCRAHVEMFEPLSTSRDAIIGYFRMAAEDARAQEGKVPFALSHAAAGLVQQGRVNIMSHALST